MKFEKEELNGMSSEEILRWLLFIRIDLSKQILVQRVILISVQFFLLEYVLEIYTKFSLKSFK